MDIIDRLRSIQNDCAQYIAGSDIMRDAANEIDQLRAQLAEAQAEIERLNNDLLDALDRNWETY